jgi:uncharacterized membrane protein
MLITGVFWGTWFTLTRSIETFMFEEFTHIGRVIIANVAMPMRIIMPSGILVVFLSLWFCENKKQWEFYAGVASFLFIVSVLLITVMILVPIDNEIKNWTTASLPRDWENIRSKWKNYHALRTLLSLMSFACFTIFILASKQTSAKI